LPMLCQQILPLLPQIAQTLRQAGQLAQELSSSQFQVHEKGPQDFVTSVDLAIDQLLTQQFQSWFAGDGVITEENTKSRQLFHRHQGRLWLIDPLDGTDDLIQGRSGYSVMVGLLEDYQPVAGWIYQPSTDYLYYGGADWGLFEIQGNASPQPLTFHPPRSLQCPLMIGYKDERLYGSAISQVIPGARLQSLGSFGLKVMEVICGRAGLYLYMNRRVKLWDTTGPLALARAAGLLCCDIHGEPLRFSPDAIEPETLAHYQTILIGWPDCVQEFRPRLQQAIAMVNASL
jgi:3'(2'), 5'-bisphosphate nucleotidase